MPPQNNRVKRKLLAAQTGFFEHSHTFLQRFQSLQVGFAKEDSPDFLQLMADASKFLGVRFRGCAKSGNPNCLGFNASLQTMHFALQTAKLCANALLSLCQ